MKHVLRFIKNKIRRAVLWVRYFFATETCDIAPEAALKALQEFSPRPTSSAITEYREFGEEYDLAIIIPAYNSGKWIRECMDSIVSQKTEYSMQILVVNDGSTDDTGSILAEYEKHPGVTVITQENKGYSGARNTAIRQVKSKYIMFVDSDDYILPDSVQLLMYTAVTNDADIVEGNGYTFNENGIIGRIKPVNENLWGGPCLKVMRSSLFSRVEFPEGYLYEDKIIGSLIHKLAKTMICVPNEVYAYRIHETSITMKRDENPKRIDSFWIMLLMREDQEKLNICMDEIILEQNIRQIFLTESRISKLSTDLKKQVFSASSFFIRKNFSNIKIEKKFSRCCSAIREGKYEKFEILTKLTNI